jgi:hypothetical protein
MADMGGWEFRRNHSSQAREERSDGEGEVTISNLAVQAETIAVEKAALMDP